MIAGVQLEYALTEFWNRSPTFSWQRELTEGLWLGVYVGGPNWILFCAQVVTFYFMRSDRTWAHLLATAFGGLSAYQGIAFGIEYGTIGWVVLGWWVPLVSVLLIYFLMKELNGAPEKHNTEE